MNRSILHVDMNNFYASVECLHRVRTRGKPVAVCGNQEDRHGIVLAKNYEAKACGVLTGDVIFRAKQKCPGIIILPPNYPLYLRYSRMAYAIYADYTDRIEPFGLDEAWLDVTGSERAFGSAEKIAEEIRGRIRNELGITASAGVSYNKVFAKLGSDRKKPDAQTVITPENYQEIVWPLPVEELLGVGRATKRKLNLKNVMSIGDLAHYPIAYLRPSLGVWADALQMFAMGQDMTPVSMMGEQSPIKSIGNSTTAPRDLVNMKDAKTVFYVLAESVAARLREQGFVCGTVQISVRDNSLISFERQMKLEYPTNLSGTLTDAAIKLLEQHYHWNKPIRSIGIRATQLAPDTRPYQVSLFVDEERRHKLQSLEAAKDSIRSRFGYRAIMRGILQADQQLSKINPKEEHVIHPVSFFR